MFCFKKGSMNRSSLHSWDNNKNVQLHSLQIKNSVWYRQLIIRCCLGLMINSFTSDFQIKFYKLKKSCLKTKKQKNFFYWNLIGWWIMQIQSILSLSKFNLYHVIHIYYYYYYYYYYFLFCCLIEIYTQLAHFYFVVFRFYILGLKFFVVNLYKLISWVFDQHK